MASSVNRTKSRTVNKNFLLKAIESFISSNVHKSPKTVETLYERLLPFADYLRKHHVTSPLEITRDHVEGFLRVIAKGRRGKPLSESSIFGFAKDIQAFLNYVADNLAPEDWPNPTRKLKIRQPTVTIRPLSEQQLCALLSLVDSRAKSTFYRARNRAMLLVLLDGALRVGELMGAKRDSLREDGMLRVRGKGAKERDVALSPGTMETIKEYMAVRTDRSQYLFACEDGRPLSYDAVKSFFHRLKRAAPDSFSNMRLSAHTLRHTSATLRRIGGMSEGDLQTYLGHSSPEMTRHYSNLALAKAANEAAIRTSPVQGLLSR